MTVLFVVDDARRLRVEVPFPRAYRAAELVRPLVPTDQPAVRESWPEFLPEYPQAYLDDLLAEAAAVQEQPTDPTPAAPPHHQEITSSDLPHYRVRVWPEHDPILGDVRDRYYPLREGKAICDHAHHDLDDAFDCARQDARRREAVRR